MQWNLVSVPDDVKRLVLRKQGEYAAEKGFRVSVPYTIYRLLKEAYLNTEKITSKG